jgi:hypothetical protein
MCVRKNEMVGRSVDIMRRLICGKVGKLRRHLPDVAYTINSKKKDFLSNIS